MLFFQNTRMKSQRKHLQLTQKQLAEQIGTTQGTICDYESGRSSPSAKAIAQLAVALHTSTDYLLGLADKPTPPSFSESVMQKDAELLTLFQMLQPDKQERVIGFIIGLYEAEQRRTSNLNE